MIDDQKDLKASITSAETDGESGNEGLDETSDKEKSTYALKVMHERGLLSDSEYKKALAELD